MVNNCSKTFIFTEYVAIFLKTYFHVADLEGQQVATWAPPHWITLSLGPNALFLFEIRKGGNKTE